MTLRILKGACLAGLALAVATPAASAGRYHVYSCRTPTGQPAPADGWSPSRTASDDILEDTCQQPGGALLAALSDVPMRAANTDSATWTFTAPAGESLAAATLWRAGDADGGAAVNTTYQFWLAGPTGTELFDECTYLSGCRAGEGDTGQPLSTANRVVVPSTNLGSQLFAVASCGGISGYKCREGEHDPHGYAAAIYLYAADLTLEQGTGPSVDNVGGELASAPSVSGTSDLTFSASDGGSGVYEAVFSVDGQAVQQAVVNENGGRCRPVGTAADGSAAFLYLQPCLAAVSAVVPFDTTRLTDGPHHLVVSVVDAAGNSAPLLDRQITVSNPAPPCATGRASQAGTSTQARLIVGWRGRRGVRVLSAFGHAQTAAGRLTTLGGAPIARATVDLVAAPAFAGAQPAVMRSPVTDSEGRFSVHLPADASSRTLCFAYRDPGGGDPPVLTRMLALEVRAGIRLGISPRITSVGRRIVFRGRVLGGPIPAKGKQLVLEASSAGGEWIEFKVIRTDARGRFRASYRFRFPGPARYRFRVRSEAESDYPYAAGASNVASVFER